MFFSLMNWQTLIYESFLFNFYDSLTISDQLEKNKNKQFVKKIKIIKYQRRHLIKIC